MNEKRLMSALCILALSTVLQGADAGAKEPLRERYAFLQTEQSEAVAQAEAQYRAAWRQARESLRQENYENAERQFREIIQEQQESRYIAESHYWQAYALYEMGGQDNLRRAALTLTEMMNYYPEHRSVEEARELLMRTHGQLMNEHADQESAERIYEFLQEWEEAHPDDGRNDDESECNDLQIVAVNSLLQMNERRALPLLQRVIEDHDKCPELREKAIFVAAQHDSPESMQLILDAARNDPNTHVRQQAVFWLSQVPGEESLDALLEFAQDRTDREVQLKAIFALSQHSSRRASEALEGLARDQQNSIEVRGQAIFWLSQSEDSFEFLSGIYSELQEPELQEKVLFSISQGDNRQAGAWLRERALDPKESQEIRKKAIFWMSQMGELSCEDMKLLYQQFQEREMKEQLIFGLSQIDESCATRSLIELARQEKDPELVEKIVFWLGQTGDDAALDFLEELINQ